MPAPSVGPVRSVTRAGAGCGAGEAAGQRQAGAPCGAAAGPAAAGAAVRGPGRVAAQPACEAPRAPSCSAPLRRLPPGPWDTYGGDKK